MPTPASRPPNGSTASKQAHDVVFYRGDAPDSPWTHLCLRQADRIFLLARADQPLAAGAAGSAGLQGARQRPAGIAAAASRRRQRRAAGAFLAAQRAVPNPIIICAPAIRRDVARLARFIAGRAVGLVLAGGGARGFAHIGIIKALKEAGVPFDQSGRHLDGRHHRRRPGAGMGRGGNDRADARRCSSTDNPLNDFTLPLIALVRGKKVSAMLREHFGDVRIEELPHALLLRSPPTSPPGASMIHRDGMLWRALRASVALPGILPPVTHHGHLLVDGGVMNNLPVDVMREQAMRRGPHHRLRRHRRDSICRRATTAMASGPGGG